MIKFEVKNRFTGEVQFTAEIDCPENKPRPWKLRLAILWAIENKADMRGTDMRRANMSWTDMRGANMSGADMSGANMSWADMSGANMSWADMSGADMRGTDMRRANMSWTDMRGANMSGADMSGANMSGARGVSHLIIDGGLRSDGYRFLLTRTDPGSWRIKAGRRNFTLLEARKHWDKTRPVGDSLGDETRLIFKHMIAMAKLRKWPREGKE